MALRIVSGIPGSGKSLYSVYRAKEHFKKENLLSTKVIRYISMVLFNGKAYIKNIFLKLFKKRLIKYRENIYKKYIYDSNNKVNNIYSDFPILLYSYYDKEEKVVKKTK